MTAIDWAVALVAVQRLAELAVARRNTRRLHAAGGIEYGAGHYPLLVALHVAWLSALLLYVPGTAPIRWPALAAYLALQPVRLWILISLGRRWTTRIIVLPGRPPVRRGPYRWLGHPNYAVVAGEIALLPLAFGVWWIALVFSALNAALLAYRIHVEEAALAAAGHVDLRGA